MKTPGSPRRSPCGPGRATYLGRAIVVWMLMAAAEMVHGTLRTLFLKPVVGDLASRQIGVFTGSAIILLIACATAGWISARTAGQRLVVGLLWLLLMISFEVTLGRVFGLSWERMVSDYLPWEGGFMLLGMAVLASSPLIASRLRRRREGGA